MFLYVSSQKFSEDTKFLKDWTNQHKSNYRKVHLIEDLVNKCKNKNIKYKAIKDGEVIIEQIK